MTDQVEFEVRVGQAVRVTDELGKVHDGLVTTIHGYPSEAAAREAGLTSPYFKPSINSVFVTDDATKNDPYGRQIERLSSLQHRDTATAQGRFYEV